MRGSLVAQAGSTPALAWAALASAALASAARCSRMMSRIDPWQPPQTAPAPQAAVTFLPLVAPVQMAPLLFTSDAAGHLLR